MHSQDNIVIINGWIGVLEPVTALVAIVLIINHFNQSNIEYNESFKILSLILLLTLFIHGIITFMLSNDPLFPSIHPIHPIHPIIDEYCQLMIQLLHILVHTAKYFAWTFRLYRITFFFQKTPFTLSDQAYYVQCICYSLIITSFLSYLFIFGEYTTINLNDERKLCITSRELDHRIFISTSLMLELLIDIILLFLLYSKTKQLKTYQINNQQYSSYFHQRNISFINTQIMTKCILADIIYMFFYLIYIASFIFNHDNNLIIYKQLLVTISFIAQIISIACSFDIKLCEINRVSDQPDPVPTQSSMENQQQYITDIMSAYYTLPTRRKNADITNIQIDRP